MSWPALNLSSVTLDSTRFMPLFSLSSASTSLDLARGLGGALLGPLSDWCAARDNSLTAIDRRVCSTSALW